MPVVIPGDVLRASVTRSGPHSFVLKLTDTTTGASFTTTKTAARAGSVSAEVIAEAPASSRTGQLPLDPFGRIRFATCTVDGLPIGTYRPDRSDISSSRQTRETTTSALTGGGMSSRSPRRPTLPRPTRSRGAGCIRRCRRRNETTGCSRSRSSGSPSSRSHASLPREVAASRLTWVGRREHEKRRRARRVRPPGAETGCYLRRWWRRIPSAPPTRPPNVAVTATAMTGTPSIA